MSITAKMMLTKVVLLSPIPKQIADINFFTEAFYDILIFYLAYISREDSIK